MKKINTLFISGIPDNRLVEVVSIKNNKTNYVLTGSTNIFFQLNDTRLNIDYLKLDFSSKENFNFDNTNIIFNQIADSDTHSKVLKKLLKQVQINPNTPIVNHPIHVLESSRNNIYNKLKNIENLNIPKTIKFVPLTPFDIDKAIKKNNFSFPIILRKTGTHGGDTVKLLNSYEDAEKLYDVALDGSAFYLIQYVDYKEDNLYKKFRLVVIDGKVYIRHIIISDSWMIHAKNKDPKYKELEVRLLNSFEEEIKPKIEPIIKQIYKKVKLDYFGIDCFIDNNFKITIFELNANMNVLIGASENTFKYVEKMKNAIVQMILDKSNY